MSIIPNWHPLFVHFPIALLITAALFVTIGFACKEKPFGIKLYQAGLYNLWLGTIAALFAVATGLYAFQTVNHDEAGHIAATIHMRWALTTMTLSLLASAVTLFKRFRSHPAILVFLITLLGAGAVAVTAYLGGENVYRNGMGVMRLPTADHHHPHTNDMDDEEEHDHE